MNGYSHIVEKWSDEKLRSELRRLEIVAGYSGPAEDRHWLYMAVLEEAQNRKLIPRRMPR